jgi:hypothetical protein
MAYDNSMSFTIFKNNNMKTDKSPPLSGSAKEVCCPNCQEKFDMWISAWSKTDKNGEKYVSGKFNPKNPSTAQKPKPDTSSYDEDSIPF